MLGWLKERKLARCGTSHPALIGRRSAKGRLGRAHPAHHQSRAPIPAEAICFSPGGTPHGHALDPVISRHTSQNGKLGPGAAGPRLPVTGLSALAGKEQGPNAIGTYLLRPPARTTPPTPAPQHLSPLPTSTMGKRVRPDGSMPALARPVSQCPSARRWMDGCWGRGRRDGDGGWAYGQGLKARQAGRLGSVLPLSSTVLLPPDHHLEPCGSFLSFLPFPPTHPDRLSCVVHSLNKGSSPTTLFCTTPKSLFTCHQLTVQAATHQQHTFHSHDALHSYCSRGPGRHCLRAEPGLQPRHQAPQGRGSHRRLDLHHRVAAPGSHCRQVCRRHRQHSSHRRRYSGDSGAPRHHRQSVLSIPYAASV